jgi:hypothetical protein
MSEEKFEQVFQVSGQAHLIVKNIRGSVDIQTGEDGTIQVTAIKHSDSGDPKRTEVELTQDSDGAVKAISRFPEGSIDWLFGHQPCKVDFVIKAPRQCALKVNGVSNTVLAAGFEGDVSVNSVSGEITLRDLKGSLRIHTVSGDADGERIAGSLVLETVSGDVVLKESVLLSVKANTVSGDLRIHTSLTEGPYDFRSVSGDVRLTVPPETHCTGELHSVSGDLVSAFPVTAYSRHHGSQLVAVQGGGVKIALHSVSGDLSLDCDGEIPPALEPVKTISSKERRAVLERVEHGELSVDEALSQLHV